MHPLALVLLLSLAPEAPPRDGLPIRDPAAQQHFERGMDYFAAGDYPAARHELELAYEREPHPDLLYARAQVHRLMGDCATAITLYEEFLRTTPTELAAKEARINLERCGVSPTREPPKTDPPPEPAPPPAPASAPAWVPPPRPRADRAGVALVSLGSVTLAAGVAVGVSASLLAADLTEAPTHRDYIDSRTRTIAASASAGALAVVGVVLTAVGATRLVRRAARARLVPGLVPGPGISLRLLF